MLSFCDESFCSALSNAEGPREHRDIGSAENVDWLKLCSGTPLPVTVVSSRHATAEEGQVEKIDQAESGLGRLLGDSDRCLK